MLTDVAARVSGRGPVLGFGCPGRMTAHTAALEVDASGAVLSPGMVTKAQRRHPGLRVDVGSMTALDDGAFAGVLARYSLIHTAPEDPPAVLASWAACPR